MPRKLKIKAVFRRRPISPSNGPVNVNDEDYLVAAVDQLRLSGGSENMPTTRFEDMGLKPQLLKGILSYGLEKPAKIQQLAIVPGTIGKDLIMQAQSGMGKTAAVAVILLNRVNPENPACQGMVLLPTRELALQVRDVISKIGQYMNNIHVEVCIGGTGKSNVQDEELRKGGAQIIVGTLGRLNNIIDEKVIDPLALRMFVVDEADKMLVGRSFRRDVKNIFLKINGQAQMMLMSATMSERALAYAGQITRSATKILVKQYELTLEGIQQFHVEAGNDDSTKLETLSELLPSLDKKHVLVFCNTRDRVRMLFTKLVERGVAVAWIDGLKPQTQRSAVLERFRTSQTRVLITSDLLGRGIDVQQVYVVISYDLPTKAEEYIHRVGRAGRYGRQGIAITFVEDEQLYALKKLEEFYNTEIPKLPANVSELLL